MALKVYNYTTYANKYSVGPLTPKGPEQAPLCLALWTGPDGGSTSQQKRVEYGNHLFSLCHVARVVWGVLG
jgi:hypothetical protein